MTDLNMHQNNNLTDDALDAELQRLLSGEPLSQTAGAGDDLSALLAAAHRLEGLRQVPEPDSAALATGRRRMLAAAAARREQRRGGPAGILAGLRRGNWGASLRRHPLASGLTALLLFTVTAGGGALAAAGDSLPDSPLYPVKLAAEQVELIMARDEQSHQQLVIQFEERRRQENERLDQKQLRGTRGAASTETRPPAGPTASMTRRAEPSETPRPGRTPEPENTRERDSDRTPTAAATPRPTETTKPEETPEKGRTPEPSKTPKGEATPTPTVTPGQTTTPRPSRTPEAERSATPRVTPSVSPSQSPARTGTPVPSGTASPSPTPTATYTGEPDID